MNGRGLALHVSPTDLNLQNRIGRVTRFVRARGFFENVEVAGIRTGDLAAAEIQDDGRIYRRFRVRKALREWSRLTRALDFLIWYAQILWFYLPRPLACVSAHTLSVLPLCWILAGLKGCKLVYEPHELETETMTAQGAAKPLLKFVERLFIGGADAVILVNGAIAEWYRGTYGLGRVYVVRNLPAPGLRDPFPPGHYARHFAFPESDMVFLYQGLIAAGRGIDLLLAAAARMPPDRHIVILGFGADVQSVRDATKRLPNVHYHPAVPGDMLLRYTAAADAALMMIEDVSLSYRYCYPNKYCESLTAGVPLICSDFLWLGGEVAHYGCGWLCAYDADALAGLLGKLGRGDIAAMRSGAQTWARDNNWAKEENVLGEIYDMLARETAPP